MLAFGVLAAQAAAIALIFNGEGHSTGDSTNLNVDWFTYNTISDQRNKINSIALGASSFLSGGAIKLFKSLGADAALQAAEKTTGLNAFGITFSITELLGGMALSALADHYVDLQESDVLT